MSRPCRPTWVPLALAFVLSAAPAPASPDAVVVFNEVHYNPLGQGEEGEWVELFNQMGIKTDVSGWRISGIGYTFPQGTVIDPGDYLVVAKSPAPGQLGPFAGSIDNSGERLRLYNQGDRLMDELDFGDNGRWPAVADGSGSTLSKRDPYTPNKPPENWAASVQIGGTPGEVNFPDADAPPPTTTVPLIALADIWRYNESGSDLGAGWASAVHPFGGDWAQGPGGLGSEGGDTIPLGTRLSLPTFNNPYVVTYYFEREFEMTAAQLASLYSLKLRHGFDDGAVIYINGVEALRVNMPSGVIDAATVASSDTVEIDELSSSVPIPSGALQAGSNRISVEVHQGRVGSSDIVFGLELDAEIAGALPGSGPEIVFNEITPATASEFWVELKNAGASPVELAGVTISASADPLREYALPAGELEPGQLMVLDEATIGFRPGDGEKLFLYDAAGTSVLDGREVTGRLRGRSVERGGAWLYPAAPTSGSANLFEFNSDVVISEIAYNPPALPATPSVPATFEKLALLNITEVWRYNNQGDELPADWAASAHPVGGNWSQGPGPIGRETGSLPVPLQTAWTLNEYSSGIVTYYFEADFSVTTELFTSVESLTITHQIDDGAVFYLNGIEVGRFNMPGGEIDAETLASPGVGNAELEELEISAAPLQVGLNRLAVEVHQSTTGSSDLVFGAAVEAVVQTEPAIEGQPFRNSDNQWLEVANRGSSTVDLGGWDFNDGIDFEFPPGTSLAPGEHACVVRDLAEFSAAFPAARVLGEFGGSLSRSGERLLLRDANKNPVDELRYFDSGRWPEAADGGGASLELRDLDADNSVGQAWAPSDETGAAAWKTYRYRGTAASNGGPDGQWSEFNMGLLSAGEILIDDLSVVANPDGAATQLLSNGDFGGGGASWRFRGTHRHAEVVDDPEQPGNEVLRIVASGGTGHMHNQIETTLLSRVSNGTEYEISFRARWVSGNNQLHTRLYFNRLARVNVNDRPEHVGTPSAPNSVAVSNIGPTYRGLIHSPAVPPVNEPVTVRVAAEDPDEVTEMRLFYSVNGGAFQSVAMGISGGYYQGGIPGHTAASVVQFYVQGTDGAGAVSFAPPAGPESRALYKVDDGQAATNGWHNYRIVMTNAERDFIHQETEVMSNDRLGVTVIDREDDIYYDVKMRLKGSERARSQNPRVGYNFRFGRDNLYRGIHRSMAIDRSEGVGSGQFELLFDVMIANSGGIVSRYYDFIKVHAPKDQHTRGAVLQMARYDEVFLESQFGDDGEGDLYEYELIYYPTTADAAGRKRPQPDGVSGVRIGDRGDDPERYRWYFLKKNNRETDDFDPIIAYNRQFGKSGAAFEQGLDEVVDVDAWFRGMAYAVLSGAGDNAGAGSQHNGMYYAFPDGRVMFLPHDMDFAFDAGRTVFANPECNRLASNPVRRRIYFGHLHDIITTTYNSGYMSMWTSHFASIDPSQNWNGHLNFINSRSNNVLSQISNSIPQVDFSISTPSPLEVASSNATVEGEGWVDVRQIRVQGNAEALAVTWLDNNSWRVVLPAPPGSSQITLEAVDFSGQVIATESITINNTTPSEPASANNIVISEINYHPTDLSAEEIAAGFTDPDQFEFLELMNMGGVLADLTGVRLIDGIDYDFAAGTTLEPGERIVIVRDRQAFSARYPAAASAMATGEFLDETGLSNGGERLHLVDAAGANIRNFSYDDDSPWPEGADGNGYSLVLVAPESNPDHSLPESWRMSVGLGGNPGTGDAVPFVGDPSADGDSDGLSAFMEYAFGSSDSIPGASEFVVSGDGAGGLSISYPRNLAADDAVLSLEISEDLLSWGPVGATLVFEGETPTGDGRAMVEWRASELVTPRGFIRVNASAR